LPETSTTVNPAAEIFKQLTQSAGAAFRFGSGVMGKSAILLFMLLLVLGSAVWRLGATAAIVGIAVLAVAAFFGWLLLILRYTQAHPETALLEGAEWTAWKKFEASAKTVVNPPALPAVADPAGAAMLPESVIQEPDR
jgi:hypothetical protein